jgi:starvation-inducible DNA-binding protein
MVAKLNKVLSNTRVLHDLYAKSHRLMRGPALHRLHLLMDKHAGGQHAFGNDA